MFEEQSDSLELQINKGPPTKQRREMKNLYSTGGENLVNEADLYLQP